MFQTLLQNVSINYRVFSSSGPIEQWAHPASMATRTNKHAVHLGRYPQREPQSRLDLMLLWFSRWVSVTRLASPLCRRLLCAAFCCLVSCILTFWRTTSCRAEKRRQTVTTDARLSLPGRQQFADMELLLLVDWVTFVDKLKNLNTNWNTIWTLFSSTYRTFPKLNY